MKCATAVRLRNDGTWLMNEGCYCQAFEDHYDDCVHVVMIVYTLWWLFDHYDDCVHVVMIAGLTVQDGHTFTMHDKFLAFLVEYECNWNKSLLH